MTATASGTETWRAQRCELSRSCVAAARAPPGSTPGLLQVHKAVREAYGKPFREGDVVGCLIHLPPGGRPFEFTKQASHSYSLRQACPGSAVCSSACLAACCLL